MRNHEQKNRETIATNVSRHHDLNEVGMLEDLGLNLIGEEEIEIDLDVLMKLGKYFNVTVWENKVHIS